MKLRFGLQAQFLSLMALALLVVLALVVLLLNRQERMQSEVEQISRDAMQRMIGDAMRRRGELTVTQLAESLVTPVLATDHGAMAGLGRAALRQPGTRYVVVYDDEGLVLHDAGDETARSHGKRMDDALASGAMAARALHTQFGPATMDVSAPILLGNRRLGGVRAGYDLNFARELEERAAANLHARLAERGDRDLVWVGMLGAGLLALGALMLWLLQRSLVGPIRQLAASARAIGAGQLDIDTPASDRADEVGDLMRAFGRMTESVNRHDHDIRHMAYTDALTGLANRLAFREALELRLQRLRGAGRELALLFADIDDFKRINDTLGHDAGDEVLLQFSRRIEQVVERLGCDDALLARFGGDEFVILIEAGPAQIADMHESASALADALLAELGKPFVVSDRHVFLGTSIGITLFPENASGVTSLMKNGDIAMHQAKSAGKNCHRFYSLAMDQAAERRVHLEHELRGAWDRGELSLAYQPVYRLADGALVGAEALLRWKHPEQGLVAPAVFIEIAEQSGLIETIGPLVLRAACADAVHWQSARTSSEPLFVAVNVSPRQLRSGDLPNVVASCLRETGLASQRLHLELTETAVIGDEVHVSNLLSQLRASGVKVWLDDFGTGFSGLSHLRRVPVDGVKIDRSFVADILRDPDDLALTTAIIAMAHSLGITVVAEGVEKEGQYAILRERGCELAQGYWLGHPVANEVFMALLYEPAGAGA